MMNTDPRRRSILSLIVVAMAAAGLVVAVAVNVGDAPFAQAGQLPVVQPSVRPQERDDELTVDIVVSDVKNLGSFKAVLLYTGAGLQIENSTAVSAGELLTASGDDDYFCFEPTIDASAVRISCVKHGPAGVSGSGALATVTFSVTSQGSGRISVSRVSLDDPSGRPIEYQTADASFSVQDPDGDAGGGLGPIRVTAVVVALILVAAVLSAARWWARSREPRQVRDADVRTRR